VTDVAIDPSALSKGIVFPLVRCLMEALDQRLLRTNIHLMVYEDAGMDQSIVEIGRGTTGLTKAAAWTIAAAPPKPWV